jgi:DNA-binding CsgD family transcriptional regulator
VATPFVGRTSELAELEALPLQALAEHRPLATLIVAPAGYGKSRLLTEVRDRIAPVGRFEVTGFETERAVPLAAASELLRDLAPHDELLGDLARRGGAALDAVRVLEAAHRATRAIRPCVLLVDDLQWLDEVSLALCHYLIRGALAERLPLVLIACSRPSPQTTATRDALAKLLGADAFSSSHLSALDRGDGSRMAVALRPDLAAAQAESLWAAAQGSPFWIETLAAPAAQGAGTDSAAATRLVLGRLEGAGSDVATLLSALAVGGRPMASEELRRVLVWSDERLREAGAQLVGRALAVEDRSGLRPGHDLIAQAALEQTDPKMRRRLHERLAAEMETEAAGDLRLLRGALEHRRRAGMPSSGLALRVALSEQRRLIGLEGLAELTAIADAGAVDRELNQALATLAAELGEHQVALDRWLLVRDALDPDQRGAATVPAAREAYRLGQGSRASALIDDARAQAPTPGQAVALGALEALVVMWLEHRIVDGASLAWKTLAGAEELAGDAGGATHLGEEDRLAYRDALLAAFDAAIQTSHPERLGPLARSLAETAGTDERARLEATVLEGVAARQVGDVGPPERHFRRAWDEARRRVLPTLAATAGYWLAQTLHDMGRLDEAEGLIGELRAIVARVGPLLEIRPTGRVRSVTHEFAISRGPWLRAIADLAEDADQEPEAHYRIGLHQMLAVSLARIDPDGAVDRVVASLEAARADQAASGCPRCRAELDLFAAEALARIGRTDAARALADVVGATNAPDSRTALHRLRLDALIADSPSAAMRHVVEVADRLGLGLDAAWARLDVARLLAPTDRRAAAEAYRDAGRFAAERGARTQQQLAEAGLRALGVRTWRRTPAPLGASASVLSRRELDVARLAAAGMSNPEIADQLFLSRKTVERHISNALAKVGARNRTELATRIEPDAK